MIRRRSASVDSIAWDGKNRFVGYRIQYSTPNVPYRKSSTDGVAWTEVAETSAVTSVGESDSEMTCVDARSCSAVRSGVICVGCGDAAIIRTL